MSYSSAKVLQRAAAEAKIKPSMILGSGKRPAPALGRALACKWMIQSLVMKGTDTSLFLGLNQPAASRGLFTRYMSILLGKSASHLPTNG